MFVFLYKTQETVIKHANSLMASDLSVFPGLDYSAGDGTNYPPKFDSTPGKPLN